MMKLFLAISFAVILAWPVAAFAVAGDEATRDRRHSLMIEANRAYAMGDEDQLRSILEAWERSPEAVEGADAEAMRLRVIRRIAQIEEQLEFLARDHSCAPRLHNHLHNGRANRASLLRTTAGTVLA